MSRATGQPRLGTAPTGAKTNVRWLSGQAMCQEPESMRKYLSQLKDLQLEEIAPDGWNAEQDYWVYSLREDFVIPGDSLHEGLVVSPDNKHFIRLELGFGPKDDSHLSK